MILFILIIIYDTGKNLPDGKNTYPKLYISKLDKSAYIYHCANTYSLS